MSVVNGLSDHKSLGSERPREGQTGDYFLGLLCLATVSHPLTHPRLSPVSLSFAEETGSLRGEDE